MDRNTITGLVIIGMLLLGYTYYNGTQATKLQKEKATRDSIAMVEETARARFAYEQRERQLALQDSLGLTPPSQSRVEQVIEVDSSTAYFGEELQAAQRGEEELFMVENDVMKVWFSNLGGKIANVELKEYKKYGGDPLIMSAEGSNHLDLSYFIQRDYHNTEINTSKYFFISDVETTQRVVGDKQVISMRLHTDDDSYLEYLYVVHKDKYMIDFNVKFVNMQSYLVNQSDITFNWETIAMQQERGFENENRYSDIHYKFPGEKGIENVGMGKETKEKDIRSRVQWVAFKQQFFSSIFIADNGFQDAFVKYATYVPTDKNLKKYSASMSVPFSNTTTEYGFKFFYGPNKFSLLKKQGDGLHFEKLVPLGGSIFSWINRYVVIPIFSFLSNKIASYGLIILILTLIMRLITLPLVYKSYLSGAKMRLIRPDVDVINEKYPKKEDALKKQQETMALYKRVGVNQFGGCLPMLVQLPIFIALFRFFPAAIELRGESFLWADDLSTYDSIAELPFSIPFYGDHVSLFTLLMAIMMYVSSRTSMSQQPAQTAPGMGGMKYMTLYFMPIMLLFMFNNYASGLTYYYFLSSTIAVLQMLLFRYVIVDDKKLHAKMEANAKEIAKKPKKQSKWQKRYSDMLKQQQEMQDRQKKTKK